MTTILISLAVGCAVGIFIASLCAAAKGGDLPVKEGYDLQKNGSGCKDPTAYKAIKNVDKESSHDTIDDILNPLIKAARAMFDAAGFEIMGRISLKSKSTGKEYK